MDTNTAHKLQNLQKFNFFKKLEFSRPTKIVFFTTLLKTVLMPINYFVIFPTSLYMLFKAKFPQQSLNIANEILTVPSQDLVSLSLLVFGIFLLADIIKQTFDIAEDGKKIGKQFESIWLPFARAIQVGFLLYTVPALWSFIWPLIK